MVDYLSFYVNGQEIVEHHPEPEWTLLWYLRNSRHQLNLTHTVSTRNVFLSMSRIETDGLEIRLW